jgi:hypothetical protein
MKKMGCKCAKQTDQYNGWECTIIDGACMFYIPDSKRCAEEWGEGPDVAVEVSDNETNDGCIDCPHVFADEEEVGVFTLGCLLREKCPRRE